jgi:hypothetical protein
MGGGMVDDAQTLRESSRGGGTSPPLNDPQQEPKTLLSVNELENKEKI